MLVETYFDCIVSALRLQRDEAEVGAYFRSQSLAGVTDNKSLTARRAREADIFNGAIYLLMGIATAQQEVAP